MCNINVLVACVISCAVSSYSYRILGVFPSLDRNNYATYRELFRELANRNHEVTLITHFSLPNAPATYNDILLSDKPTPQGLSYESVIASEGSRVPFETLVNTKAGNDDCKTLMNNHNVLHLLKARPKFDLIIAESYNSDCGLALAANLSAPYIAFNPQPVQPWQYNRLGIYFNSAHVNQAGLPYGRQPWFYERLKGFILYHLTNWVYYVGSQVTDRVFLYKYLGDNLPCLESIASNASLILVNTHQSVFGGVARSDNVIDIGGIHVRPTKPLPTEIENFINGAEHGVIYVNLGSQVQDSTLPADKLKELLATFNRLPLRILWKWDGGNIENLPKNIMTMRWFPQIDILKHENVKAFISHTGILSTIEAIDAGKPVVAIPLFGDQYGNAAALEDAGMGAVVQYPDLKKEILLDAIKQALSTKIQRQANQVSKIWHDRPTGPMESAIYWIEYVAKYNGAPNLQASSAFIPWYQRYQIDVLVFIFIVTYILLYVSWKILSACCSCACNSESSSQTVYVDHKRSKRVKFE